MKHFSLCLILSYLLLFSCNIATQTPDAAAYKTPPPANKQKVKVVGIKDGDTIEILVDGKQETVRLFGVDCPEKSQAFGQAAKKFTSALCYGKYVSVDEQPERDQYERILGTVYLTDSTTLNQELLKAGYAWHYKHYNNNEQYNYLENLARSERVGLWQDNNPIEPWNYRKTHRRQ